MCIFPMACVPSVNLESRFIDILLLRGNTTILCTSAATIFYHFVTSLYCTKTPVWGNVILLLAFERCALLISLHTSALAQFAFLLL